MSSLTRCNRCSLDDMQRRATERGVELIVTHIEAPDEMAGWISARYSDEIKAGAWFKALSDECVC